MISRVHCRYGKYDVYIGRPNHRDGHRLWQFGNPWMIGRDGKREEVIERYKNWLTNGETYGNLDATPERQEWILDNLYLLKDKVLGCFCRPNENCHGDVLIELYKEKYETM